MKNNEEIEQLKSVIEQQKRQIEDCNNIINGLDAIINKLGEELGRKQVEIVCLNLEKDSQNNNLNNIQ